jgi:capsular exopolysaccharide synthesis family protein
MNHSSGVEGLLQGIHSTVTELTRSAAAGPGSAGLPARSGCLHVPNAAAAAAETGSMELGRILGRYKWLLLGLPVVCAVAGLLVSALRTPVYQAQATVEVLAINENFLNLREVDVTAVSPDLPPESFLDAPVRILRSESLLGRVVERLRLAPAEEAREQAARRLTVRPVRLSRLLEIRYDDPDPRRAADFVNTLVEEFVRHSQEARSSASSRTGEWMGQQLKDLRARLADSENRLQAYARASDLVFTSEKDNVAETRLRQLQDELLRAHAERVARQSQYELASSAPPESLPEVLDSAALREIRVKLADLRRQLAELRPSHQPAHYRVERLESQAAELERQQQAERRNILEGIRNQYLAATRREELVKADYEQQTGRVSSQAARAIHYGTLKREVETNRQLYEAMLQKVKEAGIASGLRASNVRVVEPASVPPAPYRPSAPLHAAAGLLAGGLLGLAAVVVRERSLRAREIADRSIRGPGDTATLLQIPELGVIPLSPAGAGDAAPRNWRRYLPAASRPAAPVHGTLRVELMTSDSRPTMVAESFRAALTSILFAAPGARAPRVLVVTSPSPGEGKTTTVSNLGIALAEIRGRVLLIDADLRRPRLHEVFRLDRARGLSNLLLSPTPVSDFTPEELAVETTIPGLWVLPAGPEPEGISGLLHSRRLAALLHRLRHEFRMVLIDTPPMMQIPDARVVARLADSVVLVLRAGKTTLETALAARRRFAEDRTPVLGTILNHWDPAAHADRYGNRYGNCYYTGYYSEARKEGNEEIGAR